MDGSSILHPSQLALLPGIYRPTLLENGQVEERCNFNSLKEAEVIYACNTVRAYVVSVRRDVETHILRFGTVSR